MPRTRKTTKPTPPAPRDPLPASQVQPSLVAAAARLSAQRPGTAVTYVSETEAVIR